jgi:hypothetical protein
MTSQKQISLFTEDKSTSSQEDSLANPTQQRESDLAKRMRDTSGQRCLEQYGRFNRHGLWAKTFSVLLIGMEGWYSTRCRLTWKLKGTKYNRMYFQLYPSTLPIEETEYGLLPTPCVADTEGSPKREDQITMTNGRYIRTSDNTGTEFGAKLNDVARLLPTPQAMDCMNNPPRQITPSGRIISNQGHNGSAPLKDLAMNGLLPTPTAIETRRKPDRIQELKDKNLPLMSRELGDNSRQVGILDTMDFYGMLPTPRVKGHGNSHQRIEDGKIDDLTTMARFNMLPTPTAQIVKHGHSEKYWDNRIGKRQMDIAMWNAQTNGKTSQLNPQFVCEMMGFPPNYLNLW